MKGRILLAILILLSSELCASEEKTETPTKEIDDYDLSSLLGDLFEDDADYNSDEFRSLEAAAEKKDASVDDDTYQYNIFMDAFYARLSKEMESQDPMTMWIKASRRGNRPGRRNQINRNRQRQNANKNKRRRKGNKKRSRVLEDPNEPEFQKEETESVDFDIIVDSLEQVTTSSRSPKQLNSRQQKQNKRKQAAKRRQQQRQRNHIKREKNMVKSGFLKANVYGTSNFKRNGDVKVVQNRKRNFYLLRSNFVLDSVKLEASRRFGGKSAVTRSAEITAPEIQGNIILKISPAGKAVVHKLRIRRPKNVTVTGGLTRDAGAPLKITRHYMVRASPIINRRIMAASRNILPRNVPELVKQ